jgi:hypothetical protein
MQLRHGLSLLQRSRNKEEDSLVENCQQERDGRQKRNKIDKCNNEIGFGLLDST